MKYTDKQIEALLDGIYNGGITEDALPEGLYFAIADYLKKGLYKGFGGSLIDYTEGKTDYATLKELRDNIYMFSAAKTYVEVRGMTDLLMDGDAIKSFAEFKKDAMALYDIYNLDYLKSEYNTTLASAEMAAKWVVITDDIDTLPNLRYSTTEVACPICADLDGTVLPATDSFWDTYYPPNHYNCMCVVLQEDEDIKLTQNPPSTVHEMDDVFIGNVGKDKVIFNEDHPYFQLVPKDLGENNFGLPIPDTDE
jgi:hypothetical protein